MSSNIEYTPDLEKYLIDENIPVTGVLARDLVVGGVDKDSRKLFNIAAILGISLIVLILYIKNYRSTSEKAKNPISGKVKNFGLPGISNSCFLNSVMQQLRYMPHIEKLLENDSYEPKNNITKIVFNFLKRIKIGNVTAEEAINFRKTLNWIHDSEKNFIKQQDGMRLLNYILESCDYEISLPFQISIPVSFIDGGKNIEEYKRIYLYNILILPNENIVETLNMNNENKLKRVLEQYNRLIYNGKVMKIDEINIEKNKFIVFPPIIYFKKKCSP